MNLTKILPVVIIAAANIFYNISTKSMPDNINSFCALIITYLTAALLSAIIFILQIKPDNALAEFSKINWPSFLLGASIIGLELGFILLYRAGWKISVGSLFANICLDICLIIIGCVFYKEQMSIRQILGAALCVAGLVLISE